MPREASETARRRFVQLLGAGVGAGVGVSTAAGDGGAGGTPQANAADAAGQADSGLITVESDADFETTVSRVEPALEAQELTLVTTVDHAANAASVGQSLPPTTLFLFGNPAAGTPFIQAERSVAIDLPQKLLIWEDGGTVFLTYNDLRFIANRHGLGAAGERLATIANGLEDLVTAIASGE